jgi:hypothetical protein
VIDITCLTKVHALAIAYYISYVATTMPITLAYSLPEMYGSPSRNIWNKGEWRTVVVSRLDLDSTHQHVGSDAIAVLGHEGDRMRLALNEAGPARVVVFRTERGGADDNEILATGDMQNARLLGDIQRGLLPGWRIETISLGALDTLTQHVKSAAQSARRDQHRLVLCPFGPKPVVVFTALAALEEFSEGVWMSYPVPVTYDVDYTTGYDRTLWFTGVS